MKYSTKLIYKTYDEGYAFLSFLKRLEDKYGRKLIDTATKTVIVAPKTASKRVYWRLNWK